LNRRTALLASVIIVALLVLGIIGYTLRSALQSPQETMPPIEATTPPATPQVIRIGTDPVGSLSYKMGAYLSDVFNRHIGADLGISFYAMPFPLGGNLKALVIGDIEFAEPTDLELLDLYTYGEEFGI